jgi:hypothetical protein
MHYRQVLCGIAAAVSVFFCSTAAVAGQEKSACFCLRHKATGSIAHFGCESIPLPNKFTPETRCLNAARTVKIKIEDAEAFEVVADGKDGCHPCIPELLPPSNGRPDHPRGNEEGQNQ